MKLTTLSRLLTLGFIALSFSVSAQRNTSQKVLLTTPALVPSKAKVTSEGKKQDQCIIFRVTSATSATACPGTRNLLPAGITFELYSGTTFPTIASLPNKGNSCGDVPAAFGCGSPTDPFYCAIGINPEDVELVEGFWRPKANARICFCCYREEEPQP